MRAWELNPRPPDERQRTLAEGKYNDVTPISCYTASVITYLLPGFSTGRVIKWTTLSLNLTTSYGFCNLGIIKSIHGRCRKSNSFFCPNVACRMATNVSFRVRRANIKSVYNRKSNNLSAAPGRSKIRKNQHVIKLLVS